MGKKDQFKPNFYNLDLKNLGLLINGYINNSQQIIKINEKDVKLNLNPGDSKIFI